VEKLIDIVLISCGKVWISDPVHFYYVQKVDKITTLPHSLSTREKTEKELFT